MVKSNHRWVTAVTSFNSKHLQAHYSPHPALIHPRPLLLRFLTLVLTAVAVLQIVILSSFHFAFLELYGRMKRF
jgi:hypothetical protein